MEEDGARLAFFYPRVIFLIVLLLVVPLAMAAGGHDHNHVENAYGESLFYGHLHVRVHADTILDAEETNEESNELYSHSHLELGAQLGRGFSVNTNIKLEGESSNHDHGRNEAGGEANGNDKFFEDHPLLVEQLTLDYDSKRFSTYAGKFNPAVGFNYHDFPGVYGYQSIEEYAIRERIGLGAAIKHSAGDFGRHRLDVASFFADTTALSDSLLHQRGHTSKEDGGVANTEDLSSFSISLGGSDFYSLSNNIVERFSYRMGYAKQAKGSDSIDSESRYSFSLGYEQRFSRDLSAKLLAEHVDINHLGGEAFHDRAYSTLALQLDYQHWNIGLSCTAINNNAGEEDENHNGNIFQVSLGYAFDSGIGLGFGYQRSDEENEVTDRVGVLLSYGYDF